MAGYVGSNGKAQELIGGWVGVNGKARKIVGGWVGVNGKARRIWSSASSLIHTKQLFDYEVGQTYSMTKADMKATIKYAIMEYDYLDCLYDSVSVAIKENMKSHVNSILSYFDSVVSALADTVMVQISRVNATSIRVNVFPSAVDSSAVRVTQKNIGNVCKEYYSTSGLTATTYTAFYCLITADSITYNTVNPTSPNFIGAQVTFNDTPSLLISTNNIGVTYADSDINTVLADYDFTQSVYDSIDRLTIYGNVVQSSSGIQITSGRFARLPAEFSYRGVSFEIKIGAMNCSNTSTTHRLFTYMAQGQNQSYTGLEWLGSQNTWNIYDATTGHSLDIHDANFFANSTLKIDIESDGTWKVYKNNSLLITVSQMPLKTGASGCYILGSTYGGFNTVDIEKVKIYKL